MQLEFVYLRRAELSVHTMIDFSCKSEPGSLVLFLDRSSSKICGLLVLTYTHNGQSYMYLPHHAAGPNVVSGMMYFK